jgi:hypothetical protein
MASVLIFSSNSEGPVALGKKPHLVILLNEKQAGVLMSDFKGHRFEKNTTFLCARG